MSAPSPLRSLIPLVVGLSVGAAGAIMFLQSLPGSEDSAEERVRRLEVELHHARNRLAALEASPSSNRKSAGILGRLTDPQSRRELADGTRRIAEDIRAGRPVDPDDIFRASQPLLQDLAPLFDRMRVKEQQRVIDTMAGELARKYRLSPAGQEALKDWFMEKSEENARKWNDLISRRDATIKDLARASRDVRLDADLESFLPGLLDADQRAAFAAERIAERDQRVQAEADRKVQQLDAITVLDEGQRDQIFGLMARSSKNYDPSMVLQGSQGGIITPAPVTDRETAILAVLRPEQRDAYVAEQKRRREAAAREMEAIGLTLPANWQMFDEDDF
jgi:hypothetical protein